MRVQSLSRHLKEARTYAENTLDVMKDAMPSEKFTIRVSDHKIDQRRVLKMIECLESVVASGNVVLIQRFEEIFNS